MIFDNSIEGMGYTPDDKECKKVCPECKGTGKKFFADVNDDGSWEQVSEEIYNECLFEKDTETCDICDGEGNIVIDYEEDEYYPEDEY